jgi:ATP-dependent Clp protease ATP-binding subunit ClpC
VRAKVDAGPGEKLPTSVEIPFSTESKRVLDYTAQESDRLGHSYIGTEHLLLGLLREERSIAFTILSGYGMRLDAVRDQLTELLSATPEAPL